MHDAVLITSTCITIAAEGYLVTAHLQTCSCCEVVCACRISGVHPLVSIDAFLLPGAAYAFSEKRRTTSDALRVYCAHGGLILPSAALGSYLVPLRQREAGKRKTKHSRSLLAKAYLELGASRVAPPKAPLRPSGRRPPCADLSCLTSKADSVIRTAVAKPRPGPQRCQRACAAPAPRLRCARRPGPGSRKTWAVQCSVVSSLQNNFFRLRLLQNCWLVRRSSFWRRKSWTSSLPCATSADGRRPLWRTRSVGARGLEVCSNRISGAFASLFLAGGVLARLQGLRQPLGSSSGGAYVAMLTVPHEFSWC